MASILQRRSERAHPVGASFSLDQLAEWMQFQGLHYPLGQQSALKGADEEPPDASFATFVRWAYKGHPPVFAAIAVRMRVFSEARFLWRRYEDDGRPAPMFGNRELAVLERPWPGGTTGGLLSRMEQDASLAGNCFIRRVRQPGADRLVRLRPDWASILLGTNEDVDHPSDASDVTVAGYAYKPGGPGSESPTRLFLPDEVAHYAPTPDPLDHFRGMSWLSPVLKEVESDKAATIHKAQFFSNASTPQIIFKFERDTKREQIEEFRDVVESGHTGPWNAYKNLFVGGGADPVVVGRDFQQMDFRNVAGISETKVFMAAETHAVIVGSAEGMQGSALNAGNFAQVRRRFADMTVRPLWREAAASLEPILTRPDDGVHLWYDDRGISALRPDHKEEAETLHTKARAIADLTRDGFDAASVVEAVDGDDLSKLVHTGRPSVQTVDPGEGGENSERVVRIVRDVPGWRREDS